LKQGGGRKDEKGENEKTVRTYIIALLHQTWRFFLSLIFSFFTDILFVSRYIMIIIVISPHFSEKRIKIWLNYTSIPTRARTASRRL
jgi:hypothetical protein